MTAFKKTKKHFFLLFLLLVLPVKMPSAMAGNSNRENQNSSQSSQSFQDKEETVEVIEILDEEIKDVAVNENEEKQKSKPAGEKKDNLSHQISSIYRAGEKVSREILSEESRIDWDASFRREFEKDENEVITPSGRKEEIFFSIPPALTISSRRLLENNAYDASSALDKIPGLLFIKITDFSPVPVVRGLIGSRVKLLFDGIPLNTSSSVSGLGYLTGFIDIPSLESIEFVGASGIVNYGTGALAGIINFIPKAPAINPFISKASYSRLSFRSGTSDSSVTGHGETFFHTFDSSLGASITIENYGSLNSGLEKQSFTGFERGAFSFTVAKNIAGSHTINFGYFLSHLNEPNMRLPLPFNPELQQESTYTENNFINWDNLVRHMLFIKYINDELPPIDKLKILLGTQMIMEKMNVNINEAPVSPRVEKNKLGSNNFYGLLEAGAVTGSWGYLLYGLESSIDRINSTGTIKRLLPNGTTISNPIQRGIFENESFYSSLESYTKLELYSLAPAIITAGGRISWNYTDTQTISNLSKAGGGAQIEIRIPAGIRIRSSKVATLSDIFSFNILAGYSSRAPGIDELTAIRVFPGGVIMGDHHLQNEQAVSVQGGLKWNAGFFEGYLFYGYTHFESIITQKLQHLMVTDRLINPQYELCAAGLACWKNVNGKKANLHTVEFINVFNIRNFLFIGSTLSFARGEQENEEGEKEPMSLIPPLNGAVWVRGIHKTYGLMGELSLKWGLNQDRLSLKDKLNPGICSKPAICDETNNFLLLSLKGGAKITNRFSLNFAFINLLNRTDKMHGSTIYEPGIGALVSFEGNI